MSLDALKNAGGGGLIAQHGSMYKLLSTVYPEYLFIEVNHLYLSFPWQMYQWWRPHQVQQRGKTFSKVQLLLFNQVKDIFKGEDVEMNYLLREGGKTFEVDVFVPSRALALEYNGEYHYKYVSMYPQDQ